MSRWFRHYAGMMRDEKLVRAALRAKQPVERVVWIWGVILESAAEINNDGRYEVEAAEIAYFLRADEADVVSVLASLEAMGRLHEGHVVKWGDRQFQSDRSAVRQRRHREKQGRENTQSDGQHQVEETSRDGEVTAASRHSDAPELDTDTDTEKKESAAGAAPAQDVELYRRGKAILGHGAGGLIKKLVTVKGNVALARAAIEQASTKSNPREYIGAILRNRDPPERTVDPRL